MSSTVTVNEFEPVFPCESVAVQVTVVVPSTNVEPDNGVHDTGNDVPSTISVADWPAYVTVTPEALVASIVWDAGTVTCGATVSRTVTVNDFVPVFPLPSVAEHVTTVEPNGKVEPEAGEQEGVKVPLTMSTADAVKVEVAPEPEVASSVMSAGTVRTGTVVS